ncbi:hypothetical protein [Neptunomonas phycophila]|uniref:hypothetical protein n=1 Tax=Neptunomonas phycophila TaxID=1572645 RepID=UPI000948D5FE|nr:hypothetical protein [Neptunomonas phycophila]
MTKQGGVSRCVLILGSVALLLLAVVLFIFWQTISVKESGADVPPIIESQVEDRLINQPATNPLTGRNEQLSETRHSHPSEPLAKSVFSRDADIAVSIPTELGHGFALPLFADVDLDITFETERRIGEKKLLLQGRITGESLSTVTLTLIGDDYLMTIQDMENGKSYRLRGNQAKRRATVTEVDLAKMPAQTHEHVSVQ